MDLSILIVTYNSAGLIGGLLDHLRQDMSAEGEPLSAEVILIDNASRDGTADLVLAAMLQGESPREVRIVWNQGAGSDWSKQVISRDGSHSMRIADLDGDGDLDLFGANHQSRRVEIWINQTR